MSTQDLVKKDKDYNANVRLNHNSRMDKFRRRHKELGLCRACSSPVKPGYAHCEKCLENNRKYLRAYNKDTYYLRKENRLCVVCKVPLTDKRVKCERCRIRSNGYGSKKRDRCIQ